MRTSGRGPGRRIADGSAGRLHGSSAVAKLREVGPDFIATAPKRLVFEGIVAADQRSVFDAISGDPKSWAEWFPGVSDGGGKAGLGDERWVRVNGMTYRETVIEFDEPSRWTFRVEETSAPIANALVECWTMEPSPGPPAADPGGEQTLVRWTFALDPRLPFKLAGPLAPAVMGRLFARAMRNLERRLTRSTA